MLITRDKGPFLVVDKDAFIDSRLGGQVYSKEDEVIKPYSVASKVYNYRGK